MWIWHLARSDGGDPDGIKARCLQVGLDHLVIKITDGTSNFNGPLLRPIFAALKEGSGLALWVWTYTYGRDPEGEAAAFGNRAVERDDRPRASGPRSFESEREGNLPHGTRSRGVQAAEHQPLGRTGFRIGRCMRDPLEAAKLKAERTYNAAADQYDAEPLAFWDRYGRRTVERLSLRGGARVLDVCCGTGASALPAAQAVGPEGQVVAVDLAEELLKLGRAKAQTAGFHWVEFRRADMTALDFPNRHFDAVVCVFGIFFVPDMEAQVAELWRMVRPGGQLAITTWGPRIFAPAYEIWLQAVRQVRPDLHAAFNPWDRITSPEAVRTLFHDAGVRNVDVIPEDGYQPLRTPEDFWTIVLGSGLRWTIDQMGAELARGVKQAVLDQLAANGIDRVETNVIYGVGREHPGAI